MTALADIQGNGTMEAASGIGQPVCTATQPAVAPERLNKWYGSIHVLRDVSTG